MAKHIEDIETAVNIEYGKGKWWGSTIQSYACMKLTLKHQGLEQNHLVHAAFFHNGPHAIRHLVGYVPCLTLSMKEHRGAKYSYHNMKDGQKVSRGKVVFEGCGMDAFLHSEGICVGAPSFTIEEVQRAIEISIKYWNMIGIRHAAAALKEFNERIFDPLLNGEQTL